MQEACANSFSKVKNQKQIRKGKAITKTTSPDKTKKKIPAKKS